MSYFFYLNLFYIINCSRNSEDRESYTTYFNQKDIFTSINKKSVRDTILDRQLEENSNDESSFKPIRLLIHKDYIDYQTVVNKDEEYIQAIYKSIDKAGDLLRKIINVKPLISPIVLNQSLLETEGYNNRSLMQSLNNINSFSCDLIILVRLRENGDYDEIEHAAPKILILEDDLRPVVGSVIFKYDSIKESERKVLTKNELVNLLTYIFLHEFTHVLGFFGPILSFKGLLKTKIVERVKGSPKNKTIFIGQKAKKIASSYFNCPIEDEDGIEMDNYSLNENLYNSHWEGRILLGDYMISEIYYPEQVISEVTLALLEDLGWYKIKYYTGGLMRFGKNKGCEFLYNDCIKNDNNVVKSSFPNEFCSPVSFSTCSSGRLSRGYCFTKGDDNKADAYINRDWIYKIPMYESLTFYNQHGKELTEFCPISIETENNNNYFKGSCSIGDNNFGDQIRFKNRNTYKYSEFNDSFGEIIGNSSFCALSTLLKKNDNDERYYDYIRPTCYQMFCSEKSLTIQINEEYIVCPNEGGIIYIDGEETNYKGYLICPDYYLICSGTVQCNNMFDCVEKESLYKPFNLTINNKEKIFSENTLNTGSEIDQNNIVIGWELDEVNGTCPIYCRQCISNKQCIICNESHTYYVGTKENDENPIYCYNSTPEEGYYETTEYKSGKIYYFRCIENCIKRLVKINANNVIPSTFLIKLILHVKKKGYLVVKIIIILHIFTIAKEIMVEKHMINAIIVIMMLDFIVLIILRHHV